MMETKHNLTDLTEEITEKLVEVYDVLNVLEEIIDGDRRIHPLFKFVQRNIKTALKDIETCSELICE